MEAAPSAIPPKPNSDAMIATTKKIKAQRNISVWFKLDYYCLTDSFSDLLRASPFLSLKDLQALFQIDSLLEYAFKQIAQLVQSLRHCTNSEIPGIYPVS